MKAKSDLLGFARSLPREKFFDAERCMVRPSHPRKNQGKDIPVRDFVGRFSLDLLLTNLPRYPNVPGNHVDIVKDVVNIVSTHVAADKLVSCSDRSSRPPFQLCGSVVSP